MPVGEGGENGGVRSFYFRFSTVEDPLGHGISDPVELGV